MAFGEIKWFDSTKGYGFIVQDNGDKDVFVHHSDLMDGKDIQPGDRVSFEVATTDRGTKATGVRRS